MNIRYIVFFEYEDIVYEGITHVSYVKCTSLGNVEDEIERLRSKYEIIQLKVFPMSSALTKYNIGRL